MSWTKKTEKTDNAIYAEVLQNLIDRISSRSNNNFVFTNPNGTNQLIEFWPIIDMGDPQIRIRSSIVGSSRTEVCEAVLSTTDLSNLVSFRKDVTGETPNGKSANKEIILYNAGYLFPCFVKPRAEETFKKEVLNPLIVAMNFVPEASLNKIFEETLSAIHKQSNSQVIQQTKLADGSYISTKFEILEQAQDPESTNKKDSIIITSTKTSVSGKKEVISANVTCDTIKHSDVADSSNVPALLAMASNGGIGSGYNFRVTSYSNSATGTDFSVADVGGAQAHDIYVKALTKNVLAHHAKDLGVEISTGLDTKSATR